VCVYHSHFDRRSLCIFNTHMCNYVLTVIICLFLLIYFIRLRTYIYALTLIAAHCSVSSSCLQVACSYCTASGFTFRPVCRAHAWTFVSPGIWEKKKKEEQNGQKKMKQASARGWVKLALNTGDSFSIQGPQQGFASFLRLPRATLLDHCSQNRSGSRERRKSFSFYVPQTKLRYGMRDREMATADRNY